MLLLLKTLFTYWALGEQNEAASSHGPSRNVVQRVLAQGPRPVAAQQVKPFHANFDCHTLG